MATWEDGPEYAPVQRPAEFSRPEIAPLEIVGPAEQSAALAPTERPTFSHPGVAVLPLAELVPAVVERRDPALPFEVASSALTSMDSAWGAAHSRPAAELPGGAPLAPARPPSSGAGRDPMPTTSWTSPTALPPQASGATIAPWPPAGGTPWPAPGPATLPQASPAPWPTAGPDQGPGPHGAPWPSPTTPFPPPGRPAQLPGGFPPPGTPQWFGPGPAGLQQPQPPVRSDARSVIEASTPGLLICLGIGALFSFLAPVMICVAFFLSLRVKVAQEQVRQAFFIALGFLGFLGLVGWLSDPSDFSDWWSFVGPWALALSWGLLVAVLVLVYRGLKRRPTSPTDQPPSYPPSYPTDWP